MRVRKERFTGTGIIGRGVLGIYNPGDSRELPSGARRIVYEECEKHFSSVEEMERCLHSGSGVWDRTCSVDGLVLGIAVVENRNQINIQVWQLYVNGSKPDLSLRADLHRIGARLAVINQP